MEVSLKYDHAAVVRDVGGHAVRFFAEHGSRRFIVLGSLFLAVTGGEALYADMGVHIYVIGQLTPDMSANVDEPGPAPQIRLPPVSKIAGSLTMTGMANHPLVTPWRRWCGES